MGQCGLDPVAHLVDGVDVGHLEQLGQGRLPGRGQDLCLEGGIQCSLVQNGDKGRQQGVGEFNPCPCWTRATPSITALLISIWAASQRANSLRA